MKICILVLVIMLAGCVSDGKKPDESGKSVLWVGRMADTKLPVVGGGAERSVILGVRDDGVVVWKAGRRVAE